MDAKWNSILKQSLCFKVAVQKYNKEVNPDIPITYLKHGQMETLISLLRTDVASILPTGYGKSLIYELLPFVWEVFESARCLIIIAVPLNVIVDQVVGKLTDSIVFSEKLTGEDIRNLHKGRIKYVIGHPEDLVSDWGIDVFNSIHPKIKTFIVIDEVHCILEWGEQFRPKFKELVFLRSVFPDNRVLALTATASKRDRIEILKQLNMSIFKVINTSPVLNANVKLCVRRRPPMTGGHNTVEESYNAIFKPIIEEMFRKNIEKTIIYTKLNWCGYGLEFAKRMLLNRFFRGDINSCEMQRVAQFHSPQKKEVNAYIIHCLKDYSGPLQLVFATIALGMGADLRSVRRIVHAGPPCSLEAYIQEVGRAGRDGSTAVAELYFNSQDIGANLKHLDNSVRQYVRNTTECRRKQLSEHFSTVFTPQSPESCCDVCDKSASDYMPLRIVSLEEREMVREAILHYINSDTTCSLSRIITEDYVQHISQTFELIKDAPQIVESYGCKLEIATSLFNVVSSVVGYYEGIESSKKKAN